MGEFKGQCFGVLRTTERSKVEARAIANFRFEWKVRDKSNSAFQNMMVTKNVGEILVPLYFRFGDSHPEYGLQQTSRLWVRPKQGDQISIKVANTNTPPELTHTVVDHQCWLASHVGPYQVRRITPNPAG